MTRVQRFFFGAGAWMPRTNPLRAIMPCSVWVEGRTSALVPDICHELARELTWAEYGESVIPSDAAPHGVITESSGEHVKGAVLISLDPNQPSPEYSSTNPEPDVSEVRLILTQPVTTDLDDLGLFIARRDDLLDVLGPLTDVLRGAPPPVPEPHVFKGRPWGRAWSKSWGPNFE